MIRAWLDKESLLKRRPLYYHTDVLPLHPTYQAWLDTYRAADEWWRELYRRERESV